MHIIFSALCYLLTRLDRLACRIETVSASLSRWCIKKIRYYLIKSRYY